MSRRAVDLYLKQVKKFLHCPAKQKREMLQPLSQALQEYTQENETVSMEQLMTVFGTPQSQAEELMETLTTTEIKKAFMWKRVIVIGVIVALLIWGTVAVVALIDGHTEIHGHGEESMGNNIISTEEY